jgi:hypothetical protein
VLTSEQKHSLHRQRTQNYIRELENEVFRLRERESDLLKEVERLHLELEPFKKGVTSNELTESTALRGPESSPVVNPVVHIDLTNISAIEPKAPCSTEVSLERLDVTYAPPTIDPELLIVRRNSNDPLVDSSNLSMDAQTGINFILEYVSSRCVLLSAKILFRLEQPCLPHVKYGNLAHTDMDSSYIPEINCGDRHAFTATSMLITSPFAEHPETEPFDVPVDQIEQLLQTSSQLYLSPDELTPVQIWAYLQKLSHRYTIDHKLIRTITHELKTSVRCNR